MRVALVPAGKGSRTVADVILVGDDYEPEDGFEVVPSETANKGDLYDGKIFSPSAPPAATKDALRIDADERLDLIIARGISCTVANATPPVTISADTSADGKANILGLLAAYTEGLKAETDPTTWYQSGGNVDLTRDQLKAVAGAVFAHIDGAFAVWRPVVAGIAAGSITTHDQVAEAFAALATA